MNNVTRDEGARTLESVGNIYIIFKSHNGIQQLEVENWLFLNLLLVTTNAASIKSKNPSKRMTGLQLSMTYGHSDLYCKTTLEIFCIFIFKPEKNKQGNHVRC